MRALVPGRALITGIDFALVAHVGGVVGGKGGHNLGGGSIRSAGWGGEGQWGGRHKGFMVLVMAGKFAIHE